MVDDHEKVIGILLIEELENTIRLGKLVNKLERRIRRLKRKSARQHQVISAVKKYSRGGYIKDALKTGRSSHAVIHVPLSNEEKKDGNTDQ